MPAPLEPGTFLIASLGLEDPAFSRTIVLILQHMPDEVTLGVVLNRPLGERAKLYPREELDRLTLGMGRESAGRGEMFYQGGPVEPGSLIFLHRVEHLRGEATPIRPGLFAGGDLDSLREYRAGAGESPFLRFFLGYSEWQPGQLESEIALGAWILAPGDLDLIFSDDPGAMWQQALIALGGKYVPMSFIPEDPTLN
ncbi:MAG: YqgE/AlgH family protein [Gemmatimonadaceae bacterium]|nr:YqgE/AlgH family protein [Gemmatimonadaceae bacterium]